jgi:hypothetical protein
MERRSLSQLHKIATILSVSGKRPSSHGSSAGGGATGALA